MSTGCAKDSSDHSGMTLVCILPHKILHSTARNPAGNSAEFFPVFCHRSPGDLTFGRLKLPLGRGGFRNLRDWWEGNRQKDAAVIDHGGWGNVLLIGRILVSGEARRGAAVIVFCTRLTDILLLRNQIAVFGCYWCVIKAQSVITFVRYSDCVCRFKDANGVSCGIIKLLPVSLLGSRICYLVQLPGMERW